jgi:hypothetical protein
VGGQNNERGESIETMGKSAPVPRRSHGGLPYVCYVDLVLAGGPSPTSRIAGEEDGVDLATVPTAGKYSDRRPIVNMWKGDDILQSVDG